MRAENFLTHVSINLEVGDVLAAKQHGINISELCRRAIKAEIKRLENVV